MRPKKIRPGEPEQPYNSVAGLRTSGPDRRNLHIAVPKACYVKLKIHTFERQLTINEAFSGFVALVAAADTKALGVLNDLALAKYKGQLGEKMHGEVSDVERDMLYDLMEAAEGGS